MNHQGVPVTETLAGQTLTTLKAFFDQAGHRPSAEHWEALADIAETLEDMADEACGPTTFLSACDPGVGKSQTLAHFARALTGSGAYPDVGMIVACGRIEEVKSLARVLMGLGVSVSKFAVHTSDKDANAMGNCSVEAAQVLLTTQARIELDCDKGRHFRDASGLFYRGRPRAVRAWDEAWLPGVAVTLDRRDIYGLSKPLEHLSAALGAGIEEFADTITTLEDGDLVAVPDWETEFGVSSYKVADALADHREDERRAGRGLMQIGGRRARVVKENNKRATMLTYTDTLPADLAPMIVLDASVRVRQTYPIMQEHRPDIEELTRATKDYAPLRVHVWQTSGAKTGWKLNHEKLVRGIVDIIRTKPTQKWLVVVHKPSRKVADAAKAIREGLPADIAENVSTLPWGQHMATNEYADHANVILAGTLFTTQSHHQALAHLAQDRDLGRGFVAAEDVARVAKGEHADVILQALCRGRVRKCNGSQCLPMDAYIIAATRHGLPTALRTIFPNCTVRQWTPEGRTLTGRLADAMAVVEDAMRPEGPGWIAYATVRKVLNIDKTNFRRNVLKHPDWEDAIADRPYDEAGVGPGGRLPGLRRVEHEDARQAA